VLSQQRWWGLHVATHSQTTANWWCQICLAQLCILSGTDDRANLVMARLMIHLWVSVCLWVVSKSIPQLIPSPMDHNIQANKPPDKWSQMGNWSMTQAAKTSNIKAQKKFVNNCLNNKFPAYTVNAKYKTGPHLLLVWSHGKQQVRFKSIIMLLQNCIPTRSCKITSREQRWGYTKMISLQALLLLCLLLLTTQILFIYLFIFGCCCCDPTNSNSSCMFH